MDTAQQGTAAIGLGLMAANFWLGGARTVVSNGVLKAQNNPSAVADAHGELKKLGTEALFVAVAVFLAGTTDSIGTAMVVMMLALAVLWSLQHFSSATATGKTTTGTFPQTATRQA